MWTHIAYLNDGYVVYCEQGGPGGWLRAVGCERFAPGQRVDAGGRVIETCLAREQLQRRHRDNRPREHKVLVWRLQGAALRPFVRRGDTLTPTDAPFRVAARRDGELWERLRRRPKGAR